MASQDIAAAWSRLERVLERRPSARLHADTKALAIWDGGVRAVVQGPEGHETAIDLPAELGGEGAGPTPGWLVRAGLASCLVSCVAVVAAREGIELSALEAEVASRSDLGGMFPKLASGGVDPGPQDLEIRVRIAAPGVSVERLRDLVEIGHRISPVSAALQGPRRLALHVTTES